jgi:hypothetical protein
MGAKLGLLLWGRNIDRVLEDGVLRNIFGPERKWIMEKIA